MASTNDSKLKELISDLLPDMVARVDGLRGLWPGRDILTVLHRNESLLERMKTAIKTDKTV